MDVAVLDDDVRVAVGHLEEVLDLVGDQRVYLLVQRPEGSLTHRHDCGS
jgi:hypothetical protein